MARFFDRPNPFLSEGEARAVVVEGFPETPHQTRDNTDFPPRLRKSEARPRLASPPHARRNGAPHGRGAGGESAPAFFGADAPSESVHRRVQRRAINTPLKGRSLSPQ